jgi:hypothetical protein
MFLFFGFFLSSYELRVQKAAKSTKLTLAR